MKKKAATFYAIAVDANIDGINLVTRIKVADMFEIAADCVADGWKLVPLATEINENFYNVVFIMPTYLDDVMVTEIAINGVVVYVKENLSEVKKCIVKQERLHRLSNDAQKNIFGDDIEKQ